MCDAVSQVTLRPSRLTRAAALLIALLAGAVSLRAADDLVFTLFGDYVGSLRAQAGIPGLSATIVGGKDILWERAYGFQNVEKAVAARSDTPYQVDDLMQTLTATMLLRCVEEGRLSLDDAVGRFAATAPDPTVNLRQLLTHTSGPLANLTFTYNAERLNPLAAAVASCRGTTFRAAVVDQLQKLGMSDSVPGTDVVTVVPPADGLTDTDIARFTAVLGRLATPYAVDKSLRASVSQYKATVLTPASGLVSTLRDLAKFDLALKQGLLVRPDTLTAGWRPYVDRNDAPLPHAVGWFVQTYNGEPVVWQFGVSDGASSSLVLMLPARGLTLLLAANSDGLVKGFSLPAGDVTTSPFAKAFLGSFVR